MNWLRRWFPGGGVTFRRSLTTRLNVEHLEGRNLLSVSFHGGAILPHVELEPVYYGNNWNQSSLVQQASDLNNSLNYLAGSTYMDMLGEYGVGRGSLADDGIIDSSIAGGQTVDDTAIQRMLNGDIAAGRLLAPNQERLYVVFTGPNVTVTLGSQSSVRDFYGYHEAFTDSAGERVYYAVIVHPVGNGDFYSLSDFQTLTSTTSHEIAEAATNPDGAGWFDSNSGDEIGDLCNGQHQVGFLDGYAVQAEWSVAQNTCVLPVGAQADSAFDGSFTPSPLSPRLDQAASIFTHSDESYEHFVTGCYEQYLGRTPDQGGSDFWVTEMRQGLTEERIEASFLGSSEYIRNHGGTDRAWVAGMYQDLLGRTPRADELDYWVGQLNAGAPPSTVAYGFAASAERESLRVRDDYWTYLGRSPSGEEANYWVEQFGRGATNEDIVAGFVGSAEYYADFKKGNGNDADWIMAAYRDVMHRPANPNEVNYWLGFLNGAI